jgi:hypothetical protein
MALVKMRALALALTLVALAGTSVRGQTVSAKGTASMTFGPVTCGTSKGIGRDKKPLPECLSPSGVELAQLTADADFNALERFEADAGEATLANFERVKDSVAAHLGDFILGSLELVRTVDTTARQVSLTVRVDINAARLSNLMQRSSAVGKTEEAKRSLIGVFVMAREQASVERFDAEVHQDERVQANRQRTSNADSAGTNKEVDSVKKSTVVLHDSVSRRNQRADSVSGALSTVRASSSVQRTDRVVYAVSQAEDLNLSLGGFFAKSGFEVVESAFLDDGAKPSLVEAIKTDFGTGDDLNTQTLLRLVKAAKTAEVPFILVGTVDLGMQTKDDVTGLVRVYAKVTGKVLDLRGRLPKTVVSVEPAQYSGLGPQVAVARTNALHAAAEAIGKEVVARLNVKEVH